MRHGFRAREERAWSTDASEEGVRLDVAVARHLGDVSRAQVKKWIAEGRVRVNGKTARASHTCRTGEHVVVGIPPPIPAQPKPEAIPLDVVFEDEHLIVVNKPAGMVVHPSPGHPSGTLVNALLAHCEHWSGIGGVERPGIVHRLDAGTSGLLLAAKDDRAHRRISQQFQERAVEKRYLAVVHGTTPPEFTVDRSIGRDPRHRARISSRSHRARPARSDVTLLERLPLSSLVSIRLHTGRTHQIRVHLSESGYPVVGDRDYGPPKRRGRLSRREAVAYRELRSFPRPALHAQVLALRHPETGELMRWEAPPPKDIEDLLARLRGLRDAGEPVSGSRGRSTNGP